MSYFPYMTFIKLKFIKYFIKLCILSYNHCVKKKAFQRKSKRDTDTVSRISKLHKIKEMEVSSDLNLHIFIYKLHTLVILALETHSCFVLLDAFITILLHSCACWIISHILYMWHITPLEGKREFSQDKHKAPADLNVVIQCKALSTSKQSDLAKHFAQNQTVWIKKRKNPFQYVPRQPFSNRRGDVPL